MLLGELGGLFEAIKSIPSFIISYFIQLQFMGAVAKFIPVKEDTSRQAPKELRDRLAAQGAPYTLTSNDVTALAQEALKIKMMSAVSFMHNVCCCCSGCWAKKKRKHLKMQERFYQEFEAKLDIRNIARDSTSFARFADIFLTKEQKLLLRHQNNQAFSHKKPTNDESNKDGL